MAPEKRRSSFERWTFSVWIRGAVVLSFLFVVKAAMAIDFAREPYSPSLAAEAVAKVASLQQADVDQLLSRTVAEYQRGSTSAPDFLALYHMVALLHGTESDEVTRWIRSMEEWQAAHPNMPTRYQTRPIPVHQQVSPEILTFMASSPERLRVFMETLEPLDQRITVLQLLDMIREAHPGKIGQYFNLALAIAVVSDVAPPPDWPHGQVAEQLLPRRLNRPDQVFEYFVTLQEKGLSQNNLARMRPQELKFVVDIGGNLEELMWAVANVRTPLGRFDEVYSSIGYDDDRYKTSTYNWPHADYRLATILAHGGICVDQAYFAAMAGKARGIPTLIFRGAGLDGRHAWFGYMRADGKWEMDAGRYAENQYVTGFAVNPQTWLDITDHELRFLSEGRASTSAGRTARMHLLFARTLFDLEEFELTRQAAQNAIRYDRLNFEAWLYLAGAEMGISGNAREVEATLRRAQVAFQGYPDIVAHFSSLLVESLDARGESSRARVEEHGVTSRNVGTRVDIAITQSAERLNRMRGSSSSVEYLQAYRAILSSIGENGGMGLFDKIVRPTVVYFVESKRNAEAKMAIAYANEVLNPRSGSMLQRELLSLIELVE